MKAFFAALACVVWAVHAAAHEVRPAIGDIGVADGELRFAVTVNGEALVAGADLDGINNTDELDSSPEIDALRALPPEALQTQLETHMPIFIEAMSVKIDAHRADLKLFNLVVEDVSNPDLPRDTALMFTAPWPETGTTFSLTWPSGMGALVLRQQGIEDPYTGFLNGGDDTGPIPVGNSEDGWFSQLRSRLFGSQ